MFQKIFASTSAWTQHSLWNPALPLLRPSRLYVHRRLNCWSKRSARQTGEHGRPIPFRPSNMLSRLSDHRNPLLWIRCRLSFVRRNSPRSFAQQFLGIAWAPSTFVLPTCQTDIGHFPRLWPAEFCVLTTCHILLSSSFHLVSQPLKPDP